MVFLIIRYLVRSNELVIVKAKALKFLEIMFHESNYTHRRQDVKSSQREICVNDMG